MMSYRHILFDSDDRGIAQITVNRPEKRNALSSEVVEELRHAFEHCARERAVRALIVTGSGEKAFVAGADINELTAFSPADLREHSLRGQASFRILELCGKPSVAAINGYALGGGLELAMACTVRFASENALVGQPEVKLGLIPGYGATQRLTRLVGRGRALEMMLSGEPVPAAEAYRMGLVNAVVPQAELLAYSRAWLAKVLANAPIAIALVMDTVDAGLDGALDAGLRFEATAFAAAAATEDRTEGTRAFLEKRRAIFAGK
jgi:enoyl-CoA hydratase